MMKIYKGPWEPEPTYEPVEVLGYFNPWAWAFADQWYLIGVYIHMRTCKKCGPHDGRYIDDECLWAWTGIVP